jgi:hypothetical protein
MKRASRRRPAAAAALPGAVVVVILPAASTLDTLRAVLAQAFDGNLPSPSAAPAITGDDLIDAFLSECVDRVPGCRTQASVLAREFAKWAKTRGIAPLSCKALAIELKRRGFLSKHSSKNWWLGLKLKCSANASAEGLRRTSKRVRQRRQRHEPPNNTSS